MIWETTPGQTLAEPPQIRAGTAGRREGLLSAGQVLPLVTAHGVTATPGATSSGAV